MEMIEHDPHSGALAVDPRLVPQPSIFILYGGTGDLAQRLILPALYGLAVAGLLPRDWRLIANGRGAVTDEEFREHVWQSLESFGHSPTMSPWEDVRARLRFAGGGFTSANPGALLDVLSEVQTEMGGRPQLIHYMAVPPSAFGPLTDAIHTHGLADHARVVYEKPFGTSLPTFLELDRVVHDTFAEVQIYRIDHFLGKEATRNIHVLRFANGLFTGDWNNSRVRCVQIDVPETLGVATRASFYEETGAILDMLVTHLFQLAAEVAMEPPHCLEPECLAAEREGVIACFRPLTSDDVVVGQFEGYTELDGVPDDSRTETFVAARLWVDNDRWRGVPFLLRTGKCLAESRQRVSIQFQDPVQVLPDQPAGANTLTFDLAGDGEIDLTLVVKEPGVDVTLGVATVALPLGRGYHTPTLSAHSRLLHDVLIGDRSLFTRPDGLERAWRVAGEILHDKPEPVRYAQRSWGPAAATELAFPETWLLGE